MSVKKVCLRSYYNPSGGRLPLLSARPAVTFPAAEHHRPLAGTKICCLVTEVHTCEQLEQGCYAALRQVGFALEFCTGTGTVKYHWKTAGTVTVRAVIPWERKIYKL